MTSIERYDTGEAGADGKGKRADLTVAKHRLMCIDTPVKHDFSFTPAISIFVDCENDAELTHAFEQLAADGEVLMPLDNYGFSTKFG